jgi:hypothetical protein
MHACIYIYVAIHALASMPSAPRLSEADSKTSTEDACMYLATQVQSVAETLVSGLQPTRNPCMTGKLYKL